MFWNCAQHAFHRQSPRQGGTQSTLTGHIVARQSGCGRRAWGDDRRHSHQPFGSRWELRGWWRWTCPPQCFGRPRLANIARSLRHCLVGWSCKVLSGHYHSKSIVGNHPFVICGPQAFVFGSECLGAGYSHWKQQYRICGTDQGMSKDCSTGVGRRFPF